MGQLTDGHDLQRGAYLAVAVAQRIRPWSKSLQATVFPRRLHAAGRVLESRLAADGIDVGNRHRVLTGLGSGRPDGAARAARPISESS